MPNKFIDYYKVLDTSIEAVYSKEYPTELDRNRFIKGRYERRKNKINSHKELADFNKNLSSVQRIQRNRELDKELELVEKAYNSLKTEPLRILYHKEILLQQQKEPIEEQDIHASKKEITYTKQEQFKESLKCETEEDLKRKYDSNRYGNNNMLETFIPKTPYDRLGISIDKLQELSIEQANDYIERRKRILLEDCQKRKQRSRNSKEIQKIDLEMKLIEEAYHEVKSPTKRIQVNARIQRREEERARKIKKQEIQRKYNHISEYDPRLIRSRETSKTRTLQNKVIVRKRKPQAEKFYMDRSYRYLRIRKIGEVVYESSLNGGQSVGVYEVKRRINGEEKRDIVYTNLEEAKLATNPKTGKIEDPYYYDCVINEQFSEDSIEGSKYNGGFIGNVLKDKRGNYYHTLEQEKLPLSDREILTAILILKQREQQIESERE